MPSFRHPRDGKILTDGGSSFRLTTFAGRGEPSWGRMLASNPWRCIELELQSARHDEARAYLAQARDFFDAAGRAGTTARPLLLYYCFLNLAKTLIKVRFPAQDLSGAFHGIHECPSNKRARRFHLTSQLVDIQDTRTNKVHILRELADALGWPKPTARSSFYVCDLLAQVPSIHRAYSHSHDQAERLHPVAHTEFRFDQPTRELWVRLWIKPLGGKTSGTLRRLKGRRYFRAFFSQVENIAEGPHSGLPMFESRPIHYAQNPRSALHEFGARSVRAGFTSILTAGGYRYYLGDFDSAVRVHQVLASYLAMFYFGSVARYRPHVLEKTLGSRFAWCIDEFFATEGQQMLYQIANAILEREIVRPHALV